ncbi:phenylacetate--CoA ligase family protein, partial [Oleiphilus sp. HI0123]
EEHISGRKSVQYIREYQENKSKAHDELEAIQLAKLRKLLVHAAKTCDFYRRQWDEIGFDPSEIQSVEELSQLPILDKDVVRENYDSFVSSSFRGKNIKKTTGGSSGVPFQFELDAESNERRQAVMWRGYGGLNAGLGEKTLYLWGASIAPVGARSELKERLYHAFYNRKILNSFKMTQQNIGSYVEVLNKYKPQAVVSYVNPIVQLSDYILTNNIKVGPPKSILTGAEPLYEFQREKIEAAFQAPVYNTYGCREFMLIGSECERRQGLHVNIDHLVVETVDEQGVAAKSGDVLITDLYNYGFPLIRYRNGDRATWQDSSYQCECGSNFPMIKSVDGRKLDLVKTSDGRSIPGEFFPHLLKDYRNIRQFQVVQHNLDSIDLNVVLHDVAFKQELDHIKGLVEKNCGEHLKVNVNVVENIMLTSSGKLKVVDSKIL